jgi:alkylation response protein AidB-like acyl-CoA dehydrogenase
MTTLQAPKTASHVLDNVRALTPSIAARAAEIEAARRLPRDLLDELIEAGCFRMLVPQSHGGLGVDLVYAMRVYETLAHADASTGWTVMIGTGWPELSQLPRASFDELFAYGPDLIVAGAFNPTATIEPVDNGYRVNGRWAFASGCQHAMALYGNCVEGVVDGVPQLRMAVFAPGEVTIEDTWTVSGMRGTGSHHFRADNVIVPAERTLVPLAGTPCISEPLVRIPAPSLFPLVIGSVALGIAQGALDEIVAIAGQKTPLLAPTPLAANSLFHVELATARTELRAARALLYETAESAWTTASFGSEFTLVQRADIRAAVIWAVERAVSVVDFAYRAGGSTSLYETSALQRRLRDIHALTQHFLVRRDTLATAGAILAGQEVHVMVF